MKIKVSRNMEVELDIATIVIDVPISDKDLPDNFPGNLRSSWHAEIDLDSMTIKNYAWPEVFLVDMHVCDSGVYRLLDRSGTEVAIIRHNCVPTCLGEFGDYLDLLIQPDGKVKLFDKIDLNEWFIDSEFDIFQNFKSVQHEDTINTA